MKSVFSTRMAALTVIMLASIATIHSAPDTPSAPAPAPAPAQAPAAEPDPSTVLSKVTIDGQTIQITYGQVKDKLKVLPPQLQNAPFNDIFPILLKSIETEQIITYLADKAKTADDPEYAKLVSECQKGVKQKLFLDKEVEKRTTDAELKDAYDKYKKAAPKVDEYNLSMITLTDKTKANKVLKDAKAAGPAGFSELADKESVNKIPGGNLGYVRLDDLPEAFRDKVKGAAKATIIPNLVEVSMPDPADPSKKVTTYNIILVQDKRPATFPEFDTVKNELKTVVASKLMKDAIKDFETKAKIERFGLDGKPIDVKADALKADAPKTAPAA